MGRYSDKPTPYKELEDFPGISQEDLDRVDRRFQQYLFFENEKNGRRIWTTCCHQTGFVQEWGRTSTPGDRLVLQARHNGYVSCPYCNRILYAKNRKLLKKGLNLEEYHAVVFLHVAEDGNTVWAQGYWTTRDLMDCPSGQTLYKPTRIYRFQPGIAEQWDIDFWNNIYKRKHPKLMEPCTDNGIAGYTPVGLNRLENSFLKYTGYAEPMPQDNRGKIRWREQGIRDDLIRYLTAAARYPRQVELMRKAGMDIALGDLIWAWKKNADVIRWEETDPCKAFGLKKPELKEFMSGEKSLETLRVLKNIRKQDGKISLSEADSLRKRMDMHRFTGILSRAKDYKIPINALLRYLDGFTGPRCHGGGVTLQHVAKYWIDYIDMANQLGYDLSNPIWQMPRDLEAKHDRLAEAVNALKIEQKRQNAEQRRQEAEKKYGFTMDGWIIRAPVDAEEIAAEGRALKHCVGGYADRHMDGTLTILFLRREDDPSTPYVTIEMAGNKMVQIHGYQNERAACAVNPGKISPQKTHERLLNVWLDWIKGGSKRHENGSPVLPKRNKQKERKKIA